MRSQVKGFTLVELMITMLIAAVLLAIAVPSFNGWMQKLRLRTAAEGLLTGLQFARVEAIKRNMQVTLRSVGVNGWRINDANGLLIQSQPDGEGSRRAFVSVLPPLALDLQVDGIGFNGLGSMVSPAGVTVELSVVPVAGTDCVSTGPRGCLRVTVTPAGQVRMCDPALAAGVPQAC